MISDRVSQVGGGSLTAGGDCSFFLVDVGGGKCVLIDCGVGEGHSRLLKNLKSLDFKVTDIDTLILTHCHIDHVGGAKKLKDGSGCTIVAHKGDSDAIEGRKPELTAASWYGVEYRPVKIDRMLEKKEETVKIGEVDFHCILTPGHTPGGISVYIDDGGERILFGQDIHGPFDPSWGSDMDQWKSSMRKLIGLKADILCEGHFGIFNGKTAVKDYIEGYLNQY
jgi:glyoxylase-like metal-dependent hydrolase (beta-lactamase superfamily II)